MAMAEMMIFNFHDIPPSFDCSTLLDVRGLFLGMSKAFDKVLHEGLIYKMKCFDIEGMSLKLLQFFLENGLQRVLLNDQNFLGSQCLLVCLMHLSGPILECVRYIFASLFFMSKRELFWNKEKCFLFDFESSIHSWDNQILTFWIFKCHEVIKCLSMKHKTRFTE